MSAEGPVIGLEQRGRVRCVSFVKAGKGMLLGYARVSKGDEQSNAVQAKALHDAGCRRIFEEAASGARWDRPSCTACSTSCAMVMLSSSGSSTVYRDR
jgi:Resolvase, N terminal domain